MSSFLIDKDSPIRTLGSSMKGSSTRLRHRSRHSESENNTSAPFQRQDSFQENRKPEFENAYTSACSDTNDKSNQEMHDEFLSPRSKSNTSMIGYFMSELMKGYKLEDDAREFVERRDRVYTSVNTPKHFEKFCAFGFLQCLDSILNTATFLPLRILMALLKVITYPFSVIFLKNTRILDSAQICDLLKGVILVVSCFLTSYMDMSMIYHIVRGQSIIKFYVFYNMLDVMDKLISGFGQDVLDSLYWTAVEPRGRKREHFGTIFHLIFAIVYVVLHTMMILIQAIILNVAFNSYNRNLLSIMLSNNFVELKGNLFKRVDKQNLCQITYSDVKERFHYLVLLLFVLIRNMKELEWSWNLALPFIQDALIVLGVEIVVDWVKHAFITKFNELSASFYDDFALGLAQDIASSRKKHAFTDFSDQVCRRMGFTPIPLICLLFMVCSKSFNINGLFAWFLVFLFYLCLVSTKVLNSIILLGWAQHLTDDIKTKTTKPSGTVVNSQVIPKKDDKSSSSKPKPDKSTPVLLPDTTSLDPIINVDGLTVLEDISTPLGSPIKVSTSSYNEDQSFHILSSVSNKTFPSASCSRSHSSSSSDNEEVLVVRETKPKLCAESSPIFPQPSHDNVPFSELNSSDIPCNVDYLIENKADELLSSHEDEKVLASESSDFQLLDGSEHPPVQTDPDEAVCDTSAEPFMFKLSNSMASQDTQQLSPVPKDNVFSLVMHESSDSAVSPSSQSCSMDDKQEKDIVSADQDVNKVEECDTLHLSDIEKEETRIENDSDGDQET